MRNPEVHCPSCGSADTMRARLRGINDDAIHDQADAAAVEADEWACLRCDHVFQPHACPKCGSYRIEGALGISGQPFERPNVTVTCWDCKEVFAAHTDLVGE